MKVKGIIPVRMESTRFPGKAITPIAGKPLLKIVYDNIKNSTRLDEIVVATDSDEIRRFCSDNGINSVLTSESARNGSERIAEIALKDDFDIYVNIQGDEPMLEAWMIDLLVERMLKNKSQMATIVGPMLSEHEYRDPNTVKAVLNLRGYAMYFSRAPIPYMQRSTTNIFKHAGIYAYTKEALKIYSEKLITPLEYAESLEQLRAIEHGINIFCLNIIEASDLISINSPADVSKMENILRKSKGFQT